MRFIHAGSDCSGALTDYFGNKLFVVDAVWDEMDALSRSRLRRGELTQMDVA